jgi:hypothetical protein
MADDKQTVIRKRIGIFYENNKHFGKHFTANHFMEEGIPKSTIYNAIKKVENGINLDRKPGTGLYQQINQKIKNKLIEKSVNEIGVSDRLIGRKFKITGQYARKVLTEAGVRRKKRIKAPKSDINQKIRQKNVF